MGWIFFEVYDILASIVRSSNGRTTVSGTVYLGSSPSLTAS